MYICCKCKRAFEEPHVSLVNGGDVGEPWRSCPFCRSEDYDRAERCTLCGEYVSEMDMCIHGASVCVPCMEIVMRDARHVLLRSLGVREYNALREYLGLDARVV